MALINLKEMRVKAKERKASSGTCRVRVSEMTIEEWHEHKKNLERKKSIRRYENCVKLLERVESKHLPTTNHMLLYERICSFFDRNKYLSRVYRIMLYKLIEEVPFEEIVVKEYLWDTYSSK